MTEQSDAFFERTIQGASDPLSRHQFLLRSTPARATNLILSWILFVRLRKDQ